MTRRFNTDIKLPLDELALRSDNPEDVAAYITKLVMILNDLLRDAADVGNLEIDISDDTNLKVESPVTLTDDTIGLDVGGVDHDQLLNFEQDEHYTQSAIVETGILNAGSIASGFGSIDIGSSVFITTGLGTFGQILAELGTFGQIVDDGLTANRLVASDGSNQLISSDLTNFIEGGIGIDVIDDGDGTVTLIFDSTELDDLTWSDGSNATNTWTFDVSGQDTTMQAGDGVMAFSHDINVVQTCTVNRILAGGVTE